MPSVKNALPRPELLAPAGDWDCLRAAVANGADAVFFGLPKFNARMRAENFQDSELPEIVAFLHSHGVKAYVTLNVLIFTSELADAVAELRLLNDCGVDAVIIQDVGLAEIARRMFPALRVHASTQMTVTSPEGVAFAEELGAKQVVLSRELSLRELAKFDQSVPLEVFVHGALCVAYSGQCLTSESLGQRSANRGECAQACRMPYEIVVDGETRDLGDKRYLLSPQDLAAINEIPELIRLGIRSFKIEGRLKSPEYVAAVTAAYRKAIDHALADEAAAPSSEDLYRLEMTFSRGLFSGWMHGVNHQQLVNATYGKKRGVFLGQVTKTGGNFVELDAARHLKAGDGVVFENASNTNAEQGGRIYEVRGSQLFFENDKLNFHKIPPGTRVWKTSDPALEAELRKTHTSRIGKTDRNKFRLRLDFSGTIGEPLSLEVAGEGIFLKVATAQTLEPSQRFPLTAQTLEELFSRLNDTPYCLESVTVHFGSDVYLPKSELSKLKHEMVRQLDETFIAKRKPSGVTLDEILREACPPPAPNTEQPRLSALCRTMPQIEAALSCGIETIYADFEDIRRYKDLVAAVREKSQTAIFLATPRIQKAGEAGFFKLIENASPDGVLIRNVGAIEYFRKTPLRKIGDFSLNVSNPVTASVFRQRDLEAVTISYDLDVTQVLALLRSAPPEWFELTLHQHMPMFHMEHCVFAAFLSKGTTFLDCGRPCEKHSVHLRDRVGVTHPLRADVGCRNTLFNAVAQTGAEYFPDLLAAGLRRMRIEFLEESAGEAARTLRAYQDLLTGATTGRDLWRNLKARAQLGVTKGTLDHAHF